MDVDGPKHGVIEAHDALEHRAPLDEGPVAEVVALEREHVEREAHEDAAPLRDSLPWPDEHASLRVIARGKRC